MNRSATVLKASRSTCQAAAAGLRHSRAPVLGFKARIFRGILSHPMGKGELFIVSSNEHARCIADGPKQIKGSAPAVPSRLGWERVRVRGRAFHLFLSSLSFQKRQQVGEFLFVHSLLEFLRHE